MMRKAAKALFCMCGGASILFVMLLHWIVMDCEDDHGTKCVMVAVPEQEIEK